jgi:hypothetical protein
MLLSVFVSSINYGATDSINGTLEAQWSYNRAWQSHSPNQYWLPAQNWTPELSATLLLQKQGLGIELVTDEETLQLGDVYLDLSLENTDWSIGRKSQEWSYAFSNSKLNWIEDQPFLMREQYMQAGSWQMWCAYDPEDPYCATRLGGWWSQIDWQLLLAKGNYWKAGLAAQTTIGQGGLLYAEMHVNESQMVYQSTEVMPNIVSVESEALVNSQFNVGGQWTTPFNLTFQLESLFQQQGLTEQNWQVILSQLNTANAGMVSNAFNAPFGLQQHMLRVAQTYRNWQLEDVWVLWPDAQYSWLNQFTLNYQFNNRVDFELSWQHAGHDSALSLIGMKDRIEFTVNFTDGF